MRHTSRPPDWRQVSSEWSFGLLDDLRLAWRLLQDQRVPGVIKLVPIVAVVYVLLPVDFAPDFLIGLGQLDDVAILLLALKAFISLSPRAVVDRYLRDIKGQPAHSAPDGDETEYITAEYRILNDDE